MRTRINGSNKEFGWSGGGTIMFLSIREGGVKLLDSEFDDKEIIRLCGGGRLYYTSRSGLSGEGWVKSYGDLIPVGFYRVDCAEEPVNPVEIYEGVRIYIPYVPHEKDKGYLFNRYPVIIKRWSTVYMCSIAEVASSLRAILGGDAMEGIKVLKKTFYSFQEKEFHTREIRVWNPEGFQASLAWRFIDNELIDEFVVRRPEKILLRILRLAQTPSGEWVRTQKVWGCYYAAGPYNPSEEGLPDIPHSWRKLAENVIYLPGKDRYPVLAWKGNPVLNPHQYDEVFEDDVEKLTVLLFKEELLERFDNYLNMVVESSEDEEFAPVDDD